MRIRQLCLDRFGHFSGKVFDFGPATDKPDFHIVYGQNEAGKSTTMEAFLRLLYGFDARERYAFQHQRKNLRVSADLCIDGTEARFTRLPVRAGSLVDAHDTALPETALAAHLGGLDQQQYRDLLCLDDDTIERGGEEIARARGDIGKLLFSAAAGISGLTDVLDAARQEADQLYRKRVRTTRLAQLKAELKTVDAAIREGDVNASAYAKLRKHLAEAQAAETASRAAFGQAQAQGARHRARRAALPMLAQMETLRPRIDAGASYPDRLDIDPEGLVTLLTEQGRAESALTRLEQDLKSLDATLQALDRNPDLPQLTDALTDMQDLASRNRGAMLDLEKRRATVADTLTDMRDAAQSLTSQTVTDPLAFVLPAAALSDLEDARTALQTAHDRTIREQRETDEAAKLCDAAAQEASRHGDQPAPDASTGALLDRFSATALAARVAAANEAIASARRTASETLDALSLDGTPLDTPPPCPISPEEATDLAAKLALLAAQIHKDKTDLADLRCEADLLDARIKAIREGSAVIDDAEARALLARRDQLWADHRATLKQASADAFEAAMTQVDKAAQARLDHADRVADLRQSLDQQRKLAVRLDHAETNIARQTADHDALVAKLQSASRQAGLRTDLDASSFADWVRHHRQAIQAQLAASRVRQDHAETLDQANALAAALKERLNRPDADFETLLTQARQEAQAEQKNREAASTARNAFETAQKTLDRRRDQLQQAKQDEKQAAAHWQTLVAALLGSDCDAGRIKTGLSTLHHIRELETRRANAAKQVAAMQADQAQFQDRVRALSETFATGADLPAEDAFKALSDEATRAGRVEDRHASLSAQYEDTQRARSEAAQTLEDIARQVKTLAAVFGPSVPVSTLTELRSAVSIAQDAIAAREEFARLKAAVLTELGADTLEAAKAMLDGATPASLDAEIAEHDAQQDRYRAAFDTATETRIRAEQDLRAVSGEADIAILTERKTTLELEIEDAALRHLELSLGHRLAEEAIRRYRDSHRSAMLQATERAFADLTGGAYQKLATQPDGGTEVLLAFDVAGTPKRADDMSKGTRFQLYLALRAAAYEQLVQSGLRLPFFCDDIFETFDEERTRAACQLLERIGRSGQAIYLTHHRHVVDIARQVCQTPPMVHEITRADAGQISTG